MPVIRGGDKHGIEIRSEQQLAVVVVGKTTAVDAAGTLGGIGDLDALPGRLAAHLVHVADGQHLNGPVAEATGQVPHAHQAAADERNADPLAWPQRARGALRQGRHGPRRKPGSRGRGDGVAQELSACQPGNNDGLGRGPGAHGAPCPARSWLTLPKKVADSAISGMESSQS